MRRNNRIDKAINAKINASVRETMKKAGITNKDVLPAADEKDKMLEGLSWDELDEYVKKGNVSAQQKEAKTVGKTKEEPKVVPQKNTTDKFDRDKTKRDLETGTVPSAYEMNEEKPQTQMQQENDTYETQMQQENNTYEPQMQQENYTYEPQIPYDNTDEPDLNKSMDSVQRGNSIDEKKPEITEPPVPEIPVPEKYATYSAPVQNFVKNILNNKYIKKDNNELTPEQLDDLVSIVDEMRKSDVTVVKNMGMWLTSLEDERTLEAVVITHMIGRETSPLKDWCEETESKMQNNPKTDQNELVESFKSQIDVNRQRDAIL